MLPYDAGYLKTFSSEQRVTGYDSPEGGVIGQTILASLGSNRAEGTSLALYQIGYSLARSEVDA